MKTKLFLAVALLFAAGTMTFAQITTGEPTSKVIKTGNRPGAGDFGVYIGATSTLFQGLDKDVKMEALPLLNFKYMASRHSEWRLGLEMYRKSDFSKGDMLEDLESNKTTPDKSKESSGNILLYPGWAYHFSTKNILDVYMGLEVPVGLNSYTKATAGDNFSSSTTKRAFVVGLGAFVGIQAFIADLPLAIGAEFGVSSLLDCGLKYKHVKTLDNKEQTWYTKEQPTTSPDVAPGGTANRYYESLKARKGELGSQLRVTLTYYFK